MNIIRKSRNFSKKSNLFFPYLKYINQLIRFIKTELLTAIGNNMPLIQKISESKLELLYLYYYVIYNDILNNMKKL